MAKNFKKAERQKQIKEAAIKLITEKGYKNTSVQNILDEIKYSKSGFYHCYSSKDELIKEILHDSMEERYKNIRSIRAVLAEKNIKEFWIEALLEKILDHNKYKKLFTTLIMELPNDDNFYKFYMERIEELTVDFLNFCDKEGLGDFKIMVSDEFNVFLSSLILGTEIFKQNDNQKFKVLLRDFFTAYIDSKKLL